MSADPLDPKLIDSLAKKVISKQLPGIAAKMDIKEPITREERKRRLKGYDEEMTKLRAERKELKQVLKENERLKKSAERSALWARMLLKWIEKEVPDDPRFLPPLRERQPRTYRVGWS